MNRLHTNGDDRSIGMRLLAVLAGGQFVASVEEVVDQAVSVSTRCRTAGQTRHRPHRAAAAQIVVYIGAAKYYTL